MASLFVLLEMEIGSLRRQRIFRDRLNPLDAYSDVEFIARYRIRREMFLELHDKIETFMSRSTSRSHSLSVTTQLAVTLQFLATGSFQTVVASAHGISQPSVQWRREGGARGGGRPPGLLVRPPYGGADQISKINFNIVSAGSSFS